MLIVIAEKEELKLVEELGYKNNPILITGVGGMNVIKALKDLSRDTEILNIGYCGSNSYPIGEKVYINRVNTLHEKAQFCEKTLIVLQPKNNNINKTAKCFTSTDFVTNTNIEIPCVFDMELAYIRAMFDDVSAIKVVSDNLSHKQYKNKTKGEL